VTGTNNLVAAHSVSNIGNHSRMHTVCVVDAGTNTSTDDRNECGSMGRRTVQWVPIINL
jgi:hypothetical protein